MFFCWLRSLSTLPHPVSGQALIPCWSSVFCAGHFMSSFFAFCWATQVSDFCCALDGIASTLKVMETRTVLRIRFIVGASEGLRLREREEQAGLYHRSEREDNSERGQAFINCDLAVAKEVPHIAS